MNPIVLLRDLLQQLPYRIRFALYAVAIVLGALVGACRQFGIDAVGPVDVATVEAVLLYLAPVFGVTAVANLTRTQPRKMRRTRPRKG